MKKTRVKRIAALVLACCMLLTVVSIPAMAAPALEATVVTSEDARAYMPSWRLYSDGTLMVDAGTLRWGNDGELGVFQVRSPWNNLIHAGRRIDRVVFSGPITGRGGIGHLFPGTGVSVIEGLHHFDTRDVSDFSNLFDQYFQFTGSSSGNVSVDLYPMENWDTSSLTGMFSMLVGVGDSYLHHLDLTAWDVSRVRSMHNVFRTAGIASLDLSGWDTSNVTSLAFAFAAPNLRYLNLSGWDTRQLQGSHVAGMFRGANSLRQITLSENFVLSQHANPELPPVPQNAIYTGYWQNVGAGTPDYPQGSFVFTSDELMNAFKSSGIYPIPGTRPAIWRYPRPEGQPPADTWVWQRHPGVPPTSDTPEPPNTSELPFTDVQPGDEFYNAVRYVFERDLMRGMSDTAFSPNSTLTRAMVATILYRMAGEPQTFFRPIFTDVVGGQWYSDAITWANDMGIVRGVGDSSFAPHVQLTVEQLAAMMHRFAQHMEYDLSTLTQVTAPAGTSEWAMDYVRWAVHNNFIPAGNPSVFATRAETANFMYRFDLRYER